MRKARFYTKEP